MHDDLTRKTAIITGGNKGIGLDITKKFVEAGYHVVVGSRTVTQFDPEIANSVRHVITDVRNFEAHQNLVKEAIKWTGRLDVYVNNAGFSAWRPIGEIDEAFFNEMISTNLKGAFWGCKAAMEVLKSGSSIVNVSSIAGKRGSSNNSVYCASKFGMNGLTQALAKEIGPRGIRINGVCPVLVRTEGLIEALGKENSPAGGDIEKFFNSFAEQNAALKRLPMGSEIANMCVFLASDGASAITGQSINVDCGVFPQ